MKLTALLVAYNHERYVGQAIESALQQTVDFDYELLIVEDSSSDRTRDIVSDYAARFPDCIRLSLAERNVGANAGILRGLEAARGEYIALLDGDDYWSAPHKVAKQVRFLDEHRNYSMCFHRAFTLTEGGAIGTYPIPMFRGMISADRILRGTSMATCSVMFRREAARDLPSWYADCVFGDWLLYFVLAQRGRVGYIDETLGVYRIHNRGAWNGLDAKQKAESIRAFYGQMSAWLGEGHERALRAGLSRRNYALARWTENAGDRTEAQRIARLALKEDPWSLRLRLLLYAPDFLNSILSLRERWHPRSFPG
jgi:glycosyltransferase involved in cell wall biosynthesis